MKSNNNKKIYFASDNHLGAPDYNSSLEREKHFVQWLDFIKKDAQEIGSACTYGRRYGLAAMVGLAQVDDDGNKTVNENGV